jgi:hypothetical protein
VSIDWRDATERACDDFAPVRDHRNTPQSAVVFTRFQDGRGAEVRVSLSSAATRECAWVRLDFPAGHKVGAGDELVPVPARSESLHLCRCMAAELYAALDRAFGRDLATQPRCAEAVNE